MITSFDEILAELERTHKKKSIAVALPDNAFILKALKEVEERKLADVLLVGPQDKIKAMAQSIDYDITSKQIYDVTDEEEIAKKSVKLVHDGEAELLMKGRISTPVLMRAVLDHRFGLRHRRRLSHVGVLETENYDRLLAVSDGGINIRPNLNNKVEILQNMIQVLRGLKIEKPNIGLLCPIEEVNQKIEETVHAAKLKERADRGDFGNVTVEGPIAMDVALSAEAARRKNLHNKIAGQVDGLLVPEITVGNAFMKGMIYLANSRIGGVVVGAKVPIILLSRSDNPVQKLCSIALAIYLS